VGKQILIQVNQYVNGNSITVTRSGSDLIFDHILGTGTTSVQFGAAGQFISDGVRWLVLNRVN